MLNKKVDSLSHIKLSASSGIGSIKDLVESSKSYDHVFVVGCYEDPEYNHKLFIEQVSKNKKFIPIPIIKSFDDIEKQIHEIKALGAKGLKIHPRFMEKNFNLNSFKKALRYIQENQLVLFLCTYNFPNFKKSSYLSFDHLVESLKGVQSLKVVLLHGGVTEVMRYAELVRSNDNLLLDLSFTILKYTGSSIDLDIAFLFKYFDRRICVGTDYPDFNHQELDKKIDFFTKNISNEKKSNILYKNLLHFLGFNHE